MSTRDVPHAERLCNECGGNGVVRIPGGVSVCPRCNGSCYEPNRSVNEIVALRARVDRLDCTVREGGDLRHCRHDHHCLRCERDALLARVAQLEAALREFHDAEAARKSAADHLKAVNDRADRLYIQWLDEHYIQWLDEPTDELGARRSENLQECLRAADVDAAANRRLQASRVALTALIASPEAEGAQHG